MVINKFHSDETSSIRLEATIVFNVILCPTQSCSRTYSRRYYLLTYGQRLNKEISARYCKFF